jgi:hypothetical protein
VRCCPHCRFKKINGVLIPGGSQDLTPGHPYYDSVVLLLNLTKEANDNGDFFPVQSEVLVQHSCFCFCCGSVTLQVVGT